MFLYGVWLLSGLRSVYGLWFLYGSWSRYIRGFSCGLGFPLKATFSFVAQGFPQRVTVSLRSFPLSSPLHSPPLLFSSHYCSFGI